MFAMVATVWDGHDYIPSVWDEWLRDPAGPLLVGEQEGRPVALAKLTGVGAGQDWFEGLRVAPEQRGRGLARLMLARCVELARQRGARVLRYCTSVHNPTMHRVAEEFGFRLCYLAQWYTAERLAPGAEGQRPAEQTTALGPERLAELLGQLAGSPLLRLTGGLYSYSWLAQELTEARLREHLERGEVRGLAGGRAWAVAPPSEWGGRWLAHAEGDPAELARIFTALRHDPEPHDGPALRMQLPAATPWLPALLAAGLERGEHDQHLYELSIDARSG